MCRLALAALLLAAPPLGAQCRAPALVAPDAAPGDGAGAAVALRGDLAVVGAPRHDALGASSGCAWVFERAPDGTWHSRARLTASDGGSGQRFGAAVALGAGTIAVAKSATYDAPGAVYVFVEPSGGWSDATETVKLVSVSSAADDGFGHSIALSADGATLLVGAWGDDSGALDAGSVSFYERPPEGWAGVTRPTAVRISEIERSGYGWAVDLSADGSTALVGAPVVYQLHFHYQGPGRAIVYDRPGEGWSGNLTGRWLAASDSASSDRFGISVDLAPDGATAIVGTQQTYVMSPAQHPAYVFERPGAAWSTVTEVARLGLPDLPDWFGAAVAISADGALVGSPVEPLWDYAGRAWYYARPTAGWASTDVPSALLFAPEGGAGERLGDALALDGTRALVGAPGPLNGSGGTGLVHAFELADCAGPGLPSCLGVACPCGNDDPLAGCANSTGAGARLTGGGSASASADDLVLVATGLPPDVSGLLYAGDAMVDAPFHDGRQCALGRTVRFLASAQSSGPKGTLSHTGFVAEAAGLLAAGETWHFHAWYRDPAGPCGTGSNLSSTYSVLLAP